MITFKELTEAIKTPCQTKEGIYSIKIEPRKIKVDVSLPFDLKISNKEAKILEINIENAMELVLKPYWKK